jgi:ferrous iron transport protein A
MNAANPDPGEQAAWPRAFPLALAVVGEPVRISALRLGQGLRRRLRDLGLPLGAEIRALQRLGNGAMVVSRGAMRVALGGEMTRQVMVIRVAGARRAGPGAPEARP